MPTRDDGEIEADARPREVPTLESLALRALAQLVHAHEPEALTLPYGGGSVLMKHLARQGRLRPETLRPLLADWSSTAELETNLGSTLAASASGCRGLSALAAQRLNFQHSQRRAAQQQQQHVLLYQHHHHHHHHRQERSGGRQSSLSLPSGTRRHDAKGAGELESFSSDR